MRARPFVTLFFLAGAISMLVMSMHYFQLHLTGVLKNKPVSNELWYHIALRVHIVFGMIAMFTGPLQFIKTFRKRSVKWHKRLGYIYVSSVFTSSLFGLIVAQYAMGGLMSTLGFSTLSILWFTTTFLAIRSIIKKDILNHKKWMIRSFALTFSSIPQRLMLLMAYSPYIEFIDIYKLSSWLCWILNLAIAEWIISRMKTSNAK